MQRLRFLGQMADLGRAYAREFGLHIAERLKPGEAREPIVQVGQGGASGGFFDPIERGKERGFLLAEEYRERLLFRLRQMHKDGLIDIPVHQHTNTSGQAIQCAKGRQFTVLGEQHFESGIDGTASKETLVSIWEEVLRQERVSVHDNFFELGGHSLLATQIIVRIRQAFQVELPLRNLFLTPTVADIAEQVEAMQRTRQGSRLPPIKRLSRTIS